LAVAVALGLTAAGVTFVIADNGVQKLNDVVWLKGTTSATAEK